jgi:hypothetical protein
LNLGKKVGEECLGVGPMAEASQTRYHVVAAVLAQEKNLPPRGLGPHLRQPGLIAIPMKPATNGRNCEVHQADAKMLTQPSFGEIRPQKDGRENCREASPFAETIDKSGHDHFSLSGWKQGPCSCFVLKSTASSKIALSH